MYARHLQDPDLSPIDRRILAWIELKGRGNQSNGFVVNREGMARELGIRTSTLHERFSVLGDRVAHRWRTCGDGRQRRTSYAEVRGQNRTPLRTIGGHPRGQIRTPLKTRT